MQKQIETPAPEIAVKLAAEQGAWEGGKHEKLPPPISAILSKAAARRSDAERGQLAAYYRSIAPALAPLRDKLADLKAGGGRSYASNSFDFDYRFGDAPHRAVAASWKLDGRYRAGAQTRASASTLAPRPHEGRLTRADLARWLTSPENPLTARTFANRMWKLAFGTGLSRKVDDLGAQGAWPSHPLLLDWLAGQFVDSGWNVKHVIKLIVLSGTYRQSSETSARLRELDPENRWLSRQGRFRIDAEMVRDNALAISGLLVPKIGGPSVKPYQPPGYWSHLNFPPREWQNGSGDDFYRRSLYTHWQRQYLHPAMLAFDAPSREECTADRPRSNTPLQSLVLMNDPEFVEAARVFAERVLTSGREDDRPAARLGLSPGFVAFAKKLGSSRPDGTLDGSSGRVPQGSEGGQGAVGRRAQPAPPSIDPVELAAWTSVCRTILNLHETVTRN